MTLYLVGGPPRTGKTTLATRISREHGIGWVSTDVLRDVVAPFISGLADLGRIGVPPDGEADALAAPFARMCASAGYLAERYVIEGIGFLPRHVAALQQPDVRAVFLGFSEVRLEDIDLHAPTSWQTRIDAAQRDDLVPWLIASSECYRADAAQHGYPYVDLSGDFLGGHAAALEALGLLPDREP